MKRYSSSSRSRSRNFAPISAGSSLIEVMLAVAFMAVTALGLIAGQLWTAREARAMAMREQAAWIADSVAEAVRTPALADAATRQWNARAATLLPHGQSSVEVGAGVAVARVTWQAVRSMPANGEVIDKPESCGSADIPAGISCVALAFSQ
jgi:Tfp pilus assembly protein PilV